MQYWALPCFCIAEELKNGYTVFMKIIVTINDRGVITLPAKLRRTLNIKPEDQFIAETVPEGLLLRPAVTLPVELYTHERIEEFDSEESKLEKFLETQDHKL